MADLESSTIYVDIDALFDTRLATLRQYGDEAVTTLLSSGYYERKTDEFDGIVLSDFQARYAARDIRTLRDAMITPIGSVIVEFAKETLVALVNSPFRRQPKLLLNTYPYVLDDASERALIQGLRAYTKDWIDIEITHRTLESLTPSYVKERFSVMVMYAYWEWLEAQSLNEAFKQTQCPEVRLIGPKLVKSKEALRLLAHQNPFTALETFTGPLVKLDLWDAGLFSVDIDRFIKISALWREEASNVTPKPADSTDTPTT